MWRKYVTLPTAAVLPAAALVFTASPAFAELVLVEPRSTEEVGATTITWDSSFEDLDYTVGDTIMMRVFWDVDEGFATFAAFNLRPPNFTPKGPDPADGTVLAVVFEDVNDSGGASSSGFVDVDFRFDELHCDEEEEPDVLVGNAHFDLVLNVDTDGDGEADSDVDFGVNVHVEDPGPCQSESGPPF